MKSRALFLHPQRAFYMIGKTLTATVRSICWSVVVAATTYAPLSFANTLQTAVQASSVTAAPPATQPLAVTVEYGGNFFGFYEPPRLSVLLYAFHGEQQIVWHHARLFQLDSSLQGEINQLQHQVIEQLKALTRQNASDKQRSVDLMELTRWLAAGHYAKPVPVALDPSGAWVAPRDNPKLPAGKYRLATPRYNSTVQFVGLGGAVYQPVEALKPVWWLLQQSNVVGADAIDTVWLVDSIKPTAAINVASWNRDEVYVLAGSRIFVPLDANLLGEEFNQLNNAIAALLSYRMEE